MVKINKNEAFAILREHRMEGKGQVFSVAFTKKDGSRREMLCRFGVRSYLRGGEWANGQAGKPEQHWLAVVFDMQKQAYRSIPVDRLISMRIDGQEFTLIPLNGRK